MQEMSSKKQCIQFFAFDTKGELRAVPCRRWSCEVCQKHNAQMWAWRANLHVEADPQQFYMWTLTLGSEYTDANRAYALLKKVWDNLRQTLKRDYNKKYNISFFHWTYLAFVEGQPERDNMPHFHILSSFPAPERIKDFAVRCGFGFQADEREISGQGAGAYVAKYASKGAAVIPKDFRRVRASQDWHKLPDFTGDTLLVKSKGETLTHYLMRVERMCAVSIDTLYDRWERAKLEKEVGDLHEQD